MADYIDIPNDNGTYQLTLDPKQRLVLTEGDVNILLPNGAIDYVTKINVLFIGIEDVNLIWPRCKWKDGPLVVEPGYTYEVAFEYINRVWEVSYTKNRYVISYSNLCDFMDKFVDILDKRYATMVIEHEIVSIDDLKTKLGDEEFNKLIVASNDEKANWNELIGHKHTMDEISVDDDRFPGVTNMDELFDLLFQYASSYKNIVAEAVTGIMPYNQDDINNMTISQMIYYVDKLPYNPLSIEVTNIEYTKYGYIHMEFNTHDGILTEFGIQDIYGNINYNPTNVLNVEPDKTIKVYGRTNTGSVVTKLIETGPDLYGEV